MSGVDPIFFLNLLSEVSGTIFVRLKGEQMKTIQEADFEAEVLQYPGRVLVNFYCDWCDSCRDQTPILESLAAQYENSDRNGDGIKSLRVNIDENLNLADEYWVIYIPTLILFEDGKPLHRIVGYKWETALREVLSRLPEK